MNDSRDRTTSGTTMAAGVTTPPALPNAWHEQVEYEIACAYANGYAAALTDVAERADALDATWRPTQRRTHDEVIAHRVADMERHAAQLAERMGRPDDHVYRGGPVAWDPEPPDTARGAAA